jgi:hypothetical protein
VGTWYSSADVKRLRLEVDHSPPSSAELKNEWSCNSIPPYTLSWRAQRKLYLKEIACRCVGWTGLAQDSVKIKCLVNTTWGSIQEGKLLEQLNDYQLLKSIYLIILPT